MFVFFWSQPHNPLEPDPDFNLIVPMLCITPLYFSLLCLCTHFSTSGHVSFTPTCAQRPPGGLRLWVGHQCELQLPAWLWAVLPCCAHLCWEWDMERRPASVPAWVTISYFKIIISLIIEVSIGCPMFRLKWLFVTFLSVKYDGHSIWIFSLNVHF